MDNPFILAEIVVNYHWQDITHMPGPNEHWLPSAALLALANRTADDPDIWRWAVAEAATTRKHWLADVAAGTVNPHIWPVLAAIG